MKRFMESTEQYATGLWMKGSIPKAVCTLRQLRKKGNGEDEP